MYGIISTLHKHQSCIVLGTDIENLTDNRTLEKWYHDDLLTVSGPFGWRGRWHELLSCYLLVEVRYTSGDGHIVPDVLCHWA